MSGVGSNRQRRKTESDHKLSTLIDHTSDAMLRVRERELLPAGISSIEAAVLYTLANCKKPTTVAEISRWILREPHSTSRLIQRMEARGLVAKSRDLPRSNLVRVSMTDKGRSAYEYSMEKRDSIRELMSMLTEAEKQQLDGLLRKLLHASLDELRIKRDVPYP